jgi:pimeloyl-ACP methyl ester carboxylesterase
LFAWLLIITYVLLALVGFLGLAFASYLTYVVWRYLDRVIRIFEEKPLFIIPRGDRLASGTDVPFQTSDGVTLAGSYVRTPARKRLGVVVFCPEFGSNRWSCSAYCGHLLEAGFDLFTFDFRNHGDSERVPSYEPMQWVTNFEVRDLRAAIAYLKQRPDADPRGVGVFGVSRGGGAAIVVASEDPWIRCLATDGAFATRTTMIPYMQKWIHIYTGNKFIIWFVPRWFYGLVANLALYHVAKKRHCRFPRLGLAAARVGGRPLLMIHGEKDTYIKPAIARELFDRAAEPKEFWLVDDARHNQALHVAGAHYRRRVLDFFSRYLADEKLASPQLRLVTPYESNGADARVVCGADLPAT